jgi:ATP dependent DNA ligase domain
MPEQAAGDNPGFIAPMLATAAADLPPDADEFVAEVKRDGLRACIAVAGGRVRAWSRSGRDITAVYPELGALAAVAGRRALVLEGEIVAMSGPRPDFTVLRRRMRASRPGAGLLAAVPVTLIIFDVLHSGSEDLTGGPASSSTASCPAIPACRPSSSITGLASGAAGTGSRKTSLITIATCSACLTPDGLVSTAVAHTAAPAARRSARSCSLPSISSVSFLRPASANCSTSHCPKASATNTTNTTPAVCQPTVGRQHDRLAPGAAAIYKSRQP